MPFFSYKAIDSNGNVVKGFVEDSHIDLAHDNVSSLGFHILKINQSSSLADLYLKKISLWGIKNKDIIEFASNLSVMVKAGLPLVTSIGDIAESLENKRFRERLLDIRRTIELGSGFSAALSNHHDVFPEIFINLVAVGEETGRLDISLSDVSLHLQRMEDLKNAIIRALIYPVFALVGTTCALLFWLVYVLPKMTGLFISMDMELPLITRVLIIASDFSRAHWYLYFLIPLIAYIAVKILSLKERTKYYIDVAKLRLPVMKLILYNKLLALFAEQMRILLAAGVTIDKSFDIMINVVDNIVFKKALIQTKEDILLGSKISESLKRHRELFPNLVVRMISIGESTGNINEQLNYLSEYFLNKLDDLSQKIGKLIEPIVIVVIGLLFMVIILGLLSPIYDLISGIGK